ncbi:hypothetical protein LL127_18650 [Clostridium estertheticum]|uniref:alpha/beta fold hydrolase n=1 Tax=Clostridium estertheticum TaxID=238834 RepID=UPI00227B53E0|nr:hypothetical protein [Clostridium estertheticum]WAG45517.1 hypothetical protein LL127_18650 [Clostridium estertheticum]
MKFHEYGDKNLPHIMLIHGAGRSYWLYLREATLLQNKYHLILPVIDGHGEEGNVPYISTEKIVDQLIEYIDNNCDADTPTPRGVGFLDTLTSQILSSIKDLINYTYKNSLISLKLLLPITLMNELTIVKAHIKTFYLLLNTHTAYQINTTTLYF